MGNNIYDKISTKFKIAIEIFTDLTLMAIIFLNLLILGKLFIIREDILILLWLIVYPLIVFLESIYSRYNVKSKINSNHILRYFYYLLSIIIIVLSAKLLSDFYASFKFDVIKNFIDVIKFQEYILITFFLLVLIDIMFNEKVVIFMAVASIIYGIMNDRILNVILALIGLIVGTLNSDDIKCLLEIDKFDHKKFIKDKLHFTIATVCSAIVINDYVDKVANKLLKMKSFETINKFRDTLYIGSIRLILSIFSYATILFIILLVKDRLIKRYTKTLQTEDIKEKATKKSENNIEISNLKSVDRRYLRIIHMATMNDFIIRFINKRIKRNRTNNHKKRN